MALADTLKPVPHVGLHFFCLNIGRGACCYGKLLCQALLVSMISLLHTVEKHSKSLFKHRSGRGGRVEVGVMLENNKKTL